MEATPEPVIEPAGDAEATTAIGLGVILLAAFVFIAAIVVVVNLLRRRR